VVEEETKMKGTITDNKAIAKKGKKKRRACEVR
jgi:hypothetical protein